MKQAFRLNRRTAHSNLQRNTLIFRIETHITTEVNMRALYNQNGHVQAWLQHDDQWLVDLHGIPIGFLKDGSIYNLRGLHIAWWHGDHVRDHWGRVLLITRDAGHTGAMRPVFQSRPTPPASIVRPTLPTISLRPLAVPDKPAWGNLNVLYMAPLEGRGRRGSGR
jgi:hypothetical protein